MESPIKWPQKNPSKGHIPGVSSFPFFTVSLGALILHSQPGAGPISSSQILLDWRGYRIFSGLFHCLILLLHRKENFPVVDLNSFSCHFTLFLSDLLSAERKKLRMVFTAVGYHNASKLKKIITKPFLRFPCQAKYSQYFQHVFTWWLQIFMIQHLSLSTTGTNWFQPQRSGCQMQ